MSWHHPVPNFNNPQYGRVPPVECIDSTLHNATEERRENQAPGLPVVCGGRMKEMPFTAGLQLAWNPREVLLQMITFNAQKFVLEEKGMHMLQIHKIAIMNEK